MKRKRFSVEQIVAVLKQAELGMPVAVLNRLSAQRQAPKYLFVDKGSEFSRRLLDPWANYCKARIDFSRPG